MQQPSTFPDPTGYDDRLFRLMLLEFVRRNFSEADRQNMPDVRIAIATRYHDDETDYHESRSLVVINSHPLPLPLGPWDRDAEDRKEAHRAR